MVVRGHGAYNTITVQAQTSVSATMRHNQFAFCALEEDVGFIMVPESEMGKTRLSPKEWRENPSYG